MRKIGLFLLVILTNLLFAQQAIEGKVIDNSTMEPLAFVNILINNGQVGVSTDIDGKFRISEDSFDSLTFSYLGYEKLKLSAAALKEQAYLVRLKTNAYQIEEVEVVPGVNPAHRIIDAAVVNSEINNPEKASEFYYESYNKLWFTGKLDSAVVTTPEELNKLDSITQKKIKVFEKTHLFLMESVTERNHIPPTHSKEVVLASRVSGLKNPMFSLIGTQLQSFSLYDSYIKLFGSAYLSPISTGSTSKYLFVLEDTLFQGKDTVYSISFRPRKGKYFDGLKGVIAINTNGFAVQNFIAETINKNEINIKIQQKYEWVNNKQWFPVQLNTFITFESEDFGKMKPVGIGISYIKNIQLNSNISKKEIGNTVLSIADDAGKKQEDYWIQFRIDSLSDREKNTYHFVDSIGESIDLDRKIQLYQALFSGKFPLGPVDILLKRLIDYNGFEGFRLGIGLETNDKVFKHFRIGGYTAYGFKDEQVKYGSHLKWMPKSNRQFTTKLSYENDVVESGGTNFFDQRLNPFSSETLQKLFILQMDNIEKYELSVSFQSFRDFHFTFFGNTQFRKINSDSYLFDDPNMSTSEDQEQLFHLSEVGLETRWSYREKFVEMFGIKTPISYSYPIVHFKYSRGISDLLDGDFEYNRFDLKIEKNLWLKNLGLSSFQLHAGYIDRSIPLSALYRSEGTYNKKFLLASDFSFQTVAPNEFYEDQYFSFFYKHSFKNLLYNSKNFNPELVLVSALGYGAINSKQKHQNVEFQSMEKGLFESGIQIDQLLGFANLGVGAYYRYGYYSQPDFEDNIAFKFSSTYKF